jgi:hypothetical protein
MNARDLSDPKREPLEPNEINKILIDHAIWTPYLYEGSYKWLRLWSH